MKWPVVLIALAGCHDAFSVDQPIDVVPLGSWTPAQILDLDHAATCWNTAFGTDYRFLATDDAQRANVSFDPLECLNTEDWALTTMAFDTRVSVCPAYFEPGGSGAGSEPGALFGVFVHELGHVAGIPIEVDDHISIMGGIGPLEIFERVGDPIFSPEDHDLFAEYNPDFTGVATCNPFIADNGNHQFDCGCPLAP